MKHREFSAFCLRVFGFYLFMPNLVMVAPYCQLLVSDAEDISQWMALLSITFPLVLGALLLFKTDIFLNYFIGKSKADEKETTQSDAIVLAWGLTGLYIVVQGLTGIISNISTILYLRYLESARPLAFGYNIEYTPIVFSGIRVLIGVMFIVGWSRQGLLKLLNILSRHDRYLQIITDKIEKSSQSNPE